MLTQNFSVCGLDCHVCESFENNCLNCESVNDCELAVRHSHTGISKCPIYGCITGKGLESCGQCGELPCKLWANFRIRGWTDEEHEQSIIDRVELLRKSFKNND